MEETEYNRGGVGGPAGRTTFQRVVGLVPRLHRHPRVAKYTIMHIRRAAASDMAQEKTNQVHTTITIRMILYLITTA